MLWEELAARWSNYQPPLIPSERDVATYRAALDGRDGHVLLLGVTPQLAGLGAQLTALDASAAMIAQVWPGDAPGRQALLGNWLHDLPADRHFTATITDGGAIYLRWPDEYVLLFDRLKAVCTPGFRLVMRGHYSENVQQEACFDRLAADIASGAASDPEAIKHRVGHALVARSGDPNFRISTMVEIALDMLRDRPALRDRMISGPHRQLATTYSFPTRAQTITLLEELGYRFAPEDRDRGDAFVVCDAP